MENLTQMSTYVGVEHCDSRHERRGLVRVSPLMWRWKPCFDDTSVGWMPLGGGSGLSRRRGRGGCTLSPCLTAAGRLRSRLRRNQAAGRDGGGSDQRQGHTPSAVQPPPAPFSRFTLSRLP